MQKRSRIEIIRDILEIIQGHKKIKLTPLLRKSNLSTSRFKEYFNELEQKKFIRIIHSKNSREIVLTEKGYRYIEKYKDIMGFIEEFEL